MFQNRRRGSQMGLMLLFYQLFGVIGIDRIPPVTLGCIGLQVAIFLRLFKLPWYDVSQVCISAYNVWKKKEFIRLLYGALEHADDWHLYYNMISFAFKGQSLERKFGSLKFLYIVSSFTVLTSAVLVALNVLAGELFHYDQRTCAIGFSGVLFALKVLTTHYDRNFTHYIMGMPVIVPGRYAVWVELILIQMLVPNVSFFGHLAGVLVGMAYVSGPLKYILDGIYSTILGISRPSSQPRFSQRSERSGYANDNFNQFVPPGMTEEEQLRRAMEESMQDSYEHSYSSVPPYSDSSARSSVPPYPNSSSPRGSVPPYPSSHSGGGSVPPPPGFVFDESFHEPPAPGFAPDVEELRNRRNARFANYYAS